MDKAIDIAVLVVLGVIAMNLTLELLRLVFDVVFYRPVTFSDVDGATEGRWAVVFEDRDSSTVATFVNTATLQIVADEAKRFLAGMPGAWQLRSWHPTSIADE